VPANLPERNKKAQRREMLAAADAASSQDMLDAYTVPSVSATPAAPAPVSVSAVDPAAASAPAAATNAASDKPAEGADDSNEPEDDWETAAEKIEIAAAAAPPPPPVPVVRSLRPGGGIIQPQRLNAGALSSVKPRVLYTKEELLKYRPQPTGPEARPPSLVTYLNVVVTETIPGGKPAQSQMQRGGSFGSSDQAGVQRGLTPGYRGDPRQGQGQGQGQGGQYFGGGGGGGDDGWKREGPLPSLPQQPQSQQQQQQQPMSARRQSKGPPPPRPKKVITDPIEKLCFDVLSILNKITPQTLEKLTAKMCEIPVGSSAELDKMIELVFEKAVLDTTFANLYAEMCVTLENRSRQWGFLQFVYNKDRNEYLWIKDLNFDNVLAGPFPTVGACMEAVFSEQPPEMEPVAARVEVQEVTVVNETLMMVRDLYLDDS
jgi:hypothetical protein